MKRAAGFEDEASVEVAANVANISFITQVNIEIYNLGIVEETLKSRPQFSSCSSAEN